MHSGCVCVHMWCQIDDLCATPLGSLPRPPRRGLVAVGVGGLGQQQPPPVLPEVLTETRCSPPGPSAGLPNRARSWCAACAGFWLAASPSMAQKTGWKPWVGHSDPIHPAGLWEVRPQARGVSSQGKLVGCASSLHPELPALASLRKQPPSRAGSPSRVLPRCLPAPSPAGTSHAGPSRFVHWP